MTHSHSLSPTGGQRALNVGGVVKKPAQQQRLRDVTRTDLFICLFIYFLI